MWGDFNFTYGRHYVLNQISELGFIFAVIDGQKQNSAPPAYLREDANSFPFSSVSHCSYRNS